MKIFETHQDAVRYYRMQGLGRQEIEKMIQEGLVRISERLHAVPK